MGIREGEHWHLLVASNKPDGLVERGGRMASRLLTDVDTIVVPVTAGHVLIDVCVDPCHLVGQAASHVGDAEL